MNAFESLGFFLPEIFLLIGAFSVLGWDLITNQKKSAGLLGLLVLLGTALLARKAPLSPLGLFYGAYALDPLSHFFRMAAILMVALTFLLSLGSRTFLKYEGEYYALFLFMAFGLMLMAAAADLLMIFLSVEFVSILSYLLVGFLKKDWKAKEAAIKYFLFGSLCSGLMLYGMSLLYGASGSLELAKIRVALFNPEYFMMALAGLLFILAGLGFKISMAPFHMWAPDAYEAAPTPVTAFLTVAPKALGFCVLLRVLGTAFLGLSWKWQHVLIILSFATMTLGNLIAISQSNIKRLLAYSSIAQAGYILMGLAAFNQTGLTGILVYLAAYAFTNLGAFAAVIIVSNHVKSDELNAYAGLAKRSPLAAACMTVFLLSLAGMPPLAGFIGKFFMFSSALEAGLVKLAIAAAVNSAVAAFYYFKIVRQMYLVPAAEESPVTFSGPVWIAMLILLCGTVLLGIFPSHLINLAANALA